METNRRKMKKSKGDRIFDIVVIVVMDDCCHCLSLSILSGGYHVLQ